MKLLIEILFENEQNVLVNRSEGDGVSSELEPRKASGLKRLKLGWFGEVRFI